MPNRYRDALGIEHRYTTFPRGWTPVTLKPSELDDLTSDCSANNREEKIS